MPEQKSHVLQTWFEQVWNQARPEAIDELAAADIVAHGLVDAAGQPIAGREQFKIFWKQFRDGFPDMKIEIHETLTDGDKEAIRCTARGTHRGNGIGLVATNKQVEFTGMVIAYVRNGQLVEVWDNWDFLKLYQQLGAVQNNFV